MFKEEPAKVSAKAIIEVLGSPKGFVEQTMDTVLQDMRTKKGFRIIDEQKFKSKEQEGLFTTFAELDVEFTNYEELVGFCFDYMPSSIEITNPLDFNMPAEDLTGMLNDLLARLHEAELNKKAANARSVLLNDKLGIMLKNSIILALKQRNKSTEEISADVGIPSSDLEPFLRIYCSEGILQEKEGLYSLVENE